MISFLLEETHFRGESHPKNPPRLKTGENGGGGGGAAPCLSRLQGAAPFCAPHPAAGHGEPGTVEIALPNARNARIRDFEFARLEGVKLSGFCLATIQ